MSRISDQVRKYVEDADVAKHYGAWGVMRRDQRILIRKLCDTCDMFERTADDAMRKLMLKQSENVIEVPCKVGDKVWCIYNHPKPIEFQITILTMSKNHYSFFIETENGVYKHYCDKNFVGKWVFFTREEAEEAIAKMKGGE